MSATVTLATSLTSGGGPCVTLDDARHQCNVTGSDDNATIDRIRRSATKFVERRIGRQLITGTWTGYLDKFPRGREDIILLRPPLVSIGSIAYVDEDGASQTLATTVYEADPHWEPGRVVLKPDQNWPATQSNKRNAVTVTYDAGFGSATVNVPEDIRHAVLMLVSFWFDNHDAEVTGTISKQLEFSVDALLSTWAVPLIG